VFKVWSHYVFPRMRMVNDLPELPESVVEMYGKVQRWHLGICVVNFWSPSDAHQSAPGGSLGRKFQEFDHGFDRGPTGILIIPG